MVRGSAALAAVLVLAACGRVRFDPTKDALTGHDEDGDGIPDIIDPCPHVPGDRADRDGDGVGDACDPNPDTPTESFLIFATMQPGDQPFDDASAFGQDPDALRSVGNTSAHISHVLGTVRVDVGFDIHGLVGTGQHQVAAGVGTAAASGGTYYFGELNDNAGLRDVAVVSYDATNGYVMLDSRSYNGIHPGVGYLRLDAVATAPQTHRLEAGWIGELYDASAATPLYTGGDVLNFVFNGLDVDVRYVVVIVTH